MAKQMSPENSGGIFYIGNNIRTVRFLFRGYDIFSFRALFVLQAFIRVICKQTIREDV